MNGDEELRDRIVDAAAELFAEYGFSGTKLRMVAERAGVSRQAVRRLTGTRNELFARVIATRLTSQAADRIAAAAANPEASPPLAVLLEAARQIFAAPQLSWTVLELEALIRAHRDEEVRALESARMRKRAANVKVLAEQARAAGTVDELVDDDAFAHFALALAAGLSIVGPVMDGRPSQSNWNALLARISTAFAPSELLLEADHEARVPWRLRIDIPDRPGGLARLVSTFTTLHVYVVSTTVLATGDGVRTIDLAVLVPENVDADTLLSVAMAAGSNGHLAHGSAHDGLDLPTRVLDGATELVTNPGSAPLAAAMLVEADSFEVINATEGADDATDVLRLQWTADRHVVLHRAWAPFARAEQTRASALLRLATAIASAEGDAQAVGWVEPLKGAGTVWMRLGRPEDADAVAAMHERCSTRTRYRRYLTGVREWRDISLRQLSGGHRGATLVVMSEEGTIVGLGHVFPSGPDDGHAAEMAIIIEDAYQGRGIGTRLLRHMFEIAERLGFKKVVATVLAENTEMLRVLETTRLDWHRDVDEAVFTMSAALPVVESGRLAPSTPESGSPSRERQV